MAKILSNSQQEATLHLTEDLHVYGTFVGTLYTEANLFLYQGAKFEGEAHVAHANIQGFFQGNLAAFQSVLLSSTAQFNGVLDSPSLTCLDGAIIQGELRISGSKQ